MSAVFRLARTAGLSPGAQLSAFEKKGMELARRLRDYQDLRAGRRLEAAPLPDSPETPMGVDRLPAPRLRWTTSTDPRRLLRQLKEKFLEVRAAYLGQLAGGIQPASAAFLAAARETRPATRRLSFPAKIDLEVAYNHWAPFRFAWVVDVWSPASACCCRWDSGWKSSTRWLAAYAAGMVAMLVGFFMRMSDFRPRAGHQHVRIGGLRRPGRGRASA